MLQRREARAATRTNFFFIIFRFSILAFRTYLKTSMKGHLLRCLPLSLGNLARWEQGIFLKSLGGPERPPRVLAPLPWQSLFQFPGERIRTYVRHPIYRVLYQWGVV